MASTNTKLLYHLVFATKSRQPLITPDLRASLYPYINGIVREHRGLLLAAGGMPDHVHLLVNLRPDPSVAMHLKAIKGSSSRWINKEKPGQRFAWQIGYGAFSVSESNAAIVQRYIENQELHHRRFSFKEELVTLLEKHGVAFDARHVS